MEQGEDEQIEPVDGIVGVEVVAGGVGQLPGGGGGGCGAEALGEQEDAEAVDVLAVVEVGPPVV